MDDFRAAAAQFRERQSGRVELAAQTAAFYLATGIDLSAVCSSPMDEREKIVCRLTRLLERERLKGLRRHWSYDLGRHVALKQALDLIRSNDRQ